MKISVTTVRKKYKPRLTARTCLDQITSLGRVKATYSCLQDSRLNLYALDNIRTKSYIRSIVQTSTRTHTLTALNIYHHVLQVGRAYQTELHVFINKDH